MTCSKYFFLICLKPVGSNACLDVYETFLLQGLDGLLDANFQGYVVYPKALYFLLGHLIRRNKRILIRTTAYETTALETELEPDQLLYLKMFYLSGSWRFG